MRQFNQATKANPMASMNDIPSFIWNIFSGLPITPASKPFAELWMSRGELWLVIFAAVIVVGLVGEYWAEIREPSRPCHE
jgi:hypothetical protein